MAEQPKLPAEHMRRKEAARYLTGQGYPISHVTLRNLAKTPGAGPPYTKYGYRIIVYHRADLDAWRESKARRQG